MSRYFPIILVHCLLLFASHSAAAQKPKLRLDTVGPASQVRKLVFSEDGKRLYSAGKDKIVRTWEIVERGGKYKLVAGHKFRWEISRGERGHIFDFDISPQGLIAFAGFSAWTRTSDIAVYDIKSRKLLKKLFTNPSRTSPIRDLEFSPSGRRLAAVTDLGEIRLWDIDQWRESIVQPPTDQLQTARAINFQSETELLSTETRGDVKVQMVVRDLRQNTVRAQGEPAFPILNFERFKSGKMATAHGNGDVRLWSNGNPPTSLRKGVGNEEQLTAMTIIDDQHIAVAVTDSFTNKVASIEYWDIKATKQLEKTTVFPSGPVHAMSARPQGDLIAISGGGQHEIRLVKLKDTGTGERIVQPFSQAPAARVFSEGIPISLVACNPGPDSVEVGLALSSDAKNVSLVFDPSKSRKQDDSLPIEKWRTGDTDAGQFSIKMNQDRSLIEVFKGGQKQGFVELSPHAHGIAQSHCWIADKENNSPKALAIGTETKNGIFIYDLRKPNGGALPMLRYFRDHEGAVLSMATTSNRKLLVSAAKDLTCKFWSLEKLLDQTERFPQMASWGAVFSRLDDRTLRVDKALKSGIAHARSLPTGTRIVGIQGSLNGKSFNATTATTMLDAINRNPLWQGLIVSYKPPKLDKVDRVYITPAWEPMLTSFFSQKGQWAAWTPFGYYNSSPQGDEMFGWQLNPPTQIEGQPKFFQAAQWREDFEKPEAIERLLSEGNIEAALAEAASSPKPQPKPGLKEERKPTAEVKLDPKVKPSPSVTPKPDPVVKATPKVVVPPPPIHKAIADLAPGITILSPENGEEVIGKELVMAVQLTIPKPATVKDYKIRGTLNGAYLGQPRQQASTTAKGIQLVCQWSIPMPEDGLNKLVVSASHTTKKQFFYDRLLFDTTNPEPSSELPKLFVVGIAADRYVGDLSLQFPVKDVQTVLERLPEVTTKNYEFQDEFFLRNQEISKDLFSEDVGEIVGDIKSVATTTDLLIVYIAGHGATRNGEYFFVPPDPSLNSTDKLYDQCDTYGVQWDEIARLTDAGCRTIFILDTCFAGDVLAGAKARTRPLVSKQAVVLSSSEAGQLSYEDKSKLKHGVFTWCLLQALDMMADEDKDDIVDLDELIAYVQQEVPIKSLSVINRGAIQALASARGSGATLKAQKPVSSTHNFGFLPIATPIEK